MNQKKCKVKHMGMGRIFSKGNEQNNKLHWLHRCLIGAHGLLLKFSDCQNFIVLLMGAAVQWQFFSCSFRSLFYSYKMTHCCMH